MKEFILRHRFLLALFVAMLMGAANVQAQTSYNLWICGVQVTDANKDNLTVVTGTNGCTVTGTVSYNPADTTLTLNNANISIPNGANALKSNIEGLKVDLKGTSSINSGGWATVRFEQSAIIMG